MAKYRFEEITIEYYIKDCLEGMKNIPKGTFDLIFADPPFNLGKNYGENINDERNDYYEWCEKWVKECCRLLKDTGSIYIMNIQENIWIFQTILNEQNLIFKNIITWRNSSMPVKSRYCLNYQPIIFYTKTENYTFNYNAESHPSKAVLPWSRKNKGNLMIDQWNDIPYVSGGCMASGEAILGQEGKKSKAHPCQMPQKLIERIILFSSNPNDKILDPFLGSGVTLLQCRRTGRNGVGFELNPDYKWLIEKMMMANVKPLSAFDEELKPESDNQGGF